MHFSVMQMPRILRKSAVSGRIVGGSVELAHKHIDFLLGVRESGLQIGKQRNASFVGF